MRTDDSPGKIRVILADDHEILRDGLRSLLEERSEMEVVAQAGNGRDAVRLVREHSPDVIVMDVGMPELNGIEATRQLATEAPATKVIALSMYSDRRFVGGMFGAGASGYLLKDCAAEELVRAIRTVVVDGRPYVSPAIAGVVLDDYTQGAASPDSSALSLLTPREREVLQLLAEGRATKQVAGDLHVSVKTVETHRAKIMAKLETHSIAELTKYAIREGLTLLDD